MGPAGRTGKATFAAAARVAAHQETARGTYPACAGRCCCPAQPWRLPRGRRCHRWPRREQRRRGRWRRPFHAPLAPAAGLAGGRCSGRGLRRLGQLAAHPGAAAHACRRGGGVRRGCSACVLRAQRERSSARGGTAMLARRHPVPRRAGRGAPCAARGSGAPKRAGEGGCSPVRCVCLVRPRVTIAPARGCYARCGAAAAVAGERPRGGTDAVRSGTLARRRSSRTVIDAAALGSVEGCYASGRRRARLGAAGLRAFVLRARPRGRAGRAG
jgi:hypothetical protein